MLFHSACGLLESLPYFIFGKEETFLIAQLFCVDFCNCIQEEKLFIKIKNCLALLSEVCHHGYSAVILECSITETKQNCEHGRSDYMSSLKNLLENELQTTEQCLNP